MQKKSNTNKQIPYLYAQNCPQQPLVFRAFTSQISYKKKMLHQDRQSFLSFNKGPHKISVNQVQRFNNRYEVSYHNREIQILNNRIANCKSLSQRKKDHNDAFIYPTYLIRERKMVKNELIKPHFRVTKYSKHRRIGQQPQKDSNIYSLPFTNSQSLAVPFLSANSKNIIDNLPFCTSESILSYIISRRIYEQKDLLILRARLNHHYGQNQVKIQWSEIQPHLQMFL